MAPAAAQHDHAKRIVVGDGRRMRDSISIIAKSSVLSAQDDSASASRRRRRAREDRMDIVAPTCGLAKRTRFFQLVNCVGDIHALAAQNSAIASANPRSPMHAVNASSPA